MNISTKFTFLPCFFSQKVLDTAVSCVLSISCPDHVAAPQRAYRPFEVSRSASQQSLEVILHPTSQVGRLSPGGGGGPVAHPDAPSILLPASPRRAQSKKLQRLRNTSTLVIHIFYGPRTCQGSQENYSNTLQS